MKMEHFIHRGLSTLERLRDLFQYPIFSHKNNQKNLYKYIIYIVL